MLDLITSLLAVALLLAAIAPVLMAGGACIAAFMMQKDVLKHVALTVACLATLTLSALLCVGAMASLPAVVKAFVLAAPAWGVYLLGKHFLFSSHT